MRRPILLMPSQHPQQRDLSAPLTMWVLYRPNTRDFHGSWVMRLYTLPPGRESRRLRRGTFHLAETLTGLRNRIPFGFHNLGRHPDDDETIEEVWI